MPTTTSAELFGSLLNSWEPKIQFQPTGPSGARLMIVGEAPGKDEVSLGAPFVGASGQLMDACLRDAGLSRGQAFVTNVAREQPQGGDAGIWVAETIRARTPQHKLISGKWVLPPLVFGRELLHKEILEHRPTLVIAAGNFALWALTGHWGIRKWRSSVLQAEIGGHQFKVVPVLHPAAILREYGLKPLLIHDLRRAERELAKGPIVEKPEWAFLIRPSFDQTIQILDNLEAQLNAATNPIPLSGDTETRAGHTACLGIAWSKLEAICIPFMSVQRPNYWTVDEETDIVIRLQRLLTHPMASWTWQNGAYDHQYEYRWHFVQPGLGWDTMLAHHAMFSITPKALDHLSSLYCEYHRFWKDDGRNWDPSSMPEEQYWTYNCEDCVRTYEIREVEEEAIAAMAVDWPKLPEVVAFQHKVQPVITRMMLRGVRSDDIARGAMAKELLTRSADLQSEINFMAGKELNINSSPQMQEFFYTLCAVTPIKNRNPDGSWSMTCDDEALETIGARVPVLRPLCDHIRALRSVGKFLSTYVEMRRDYDGRLRCSYNVAGTKTYRLSSSTNAFNSGGNLQNIPSGDEEEDAEVQLPNIRKLFLPDHGKTWFDLDGDSADLRIVTGESGCKQMQAYFAAGAKPYVEIAREFYRDPTITKKHRSYKTMKALCHGSNYGGEAPGLADRIGLPVRDIERIQKWYFGMCPEIKAWQDDIRAQIVGRGFIENPFGYRLWNWDRPSRKLLNEALAWTPQSTVGILINKIAVEIDAQLPWCELLLQVHDSLDGQFPSYMGDQAKAEILRVADSIEIPCRSGPIRVPSGIKTSTQSWGHCG